MRTTFGKGSPAEWTIEVFHDGDCPLCRREMMLLRRLDQRGRIKFTDIAAPDFDAAALGTDLETLNAQIHARLRDGTWLEGLDVFRRLYEAAGVTWPVAFSRLPIVAQVLDLGYRIFARYRRGLTGRCPSGACTAKRKMSRRS